MPSLIAVVLAMVVQSTVDMLIRQNHGPTLGADNEPIEIVGITDGSGSSGCMSPGWTFPSSIYAHSVVTVPMHAERMP